MRKLLNLLLVFSLGIQIVFAQQNQSSPFSYYGIGDVYSGGLALNRSLSGLGIGMNSSYYLNGINPAGLCAMDTMSFTFELGTSGQMSQLKAGSLSENSFHGNIDYIAIGFPIARWMKMSVGFNPLSTVGYNLTSFQPSPDDSFQLKRTIEGEGGINQLYFDNSITIFKKFSIGIHTAYNFGNIISTITDMPVDNETEVSRFVDSTETLYRDWYISFGFQYTDKINDEYQLTVGVIGGMEQKVNNEFSSIQRSISIGHTGDDIVLSEKKKTEGSLKMPMFYGIGFSISNENVTYAVDYRFSNWSKVALDNRYEKYFDEQKLVAGIQYLPRPRTATKYYQRMRYRLSGLYQTHYLGLFKEQVKELGINFGVSLPIRRSKSTLNISMGMGKRGTISSNTLNQNYIRFNLDLSLHDIWFMKRKYD